MRKITKTIDSLFVTSGVFLTRQGLWGNGTTKLFLFLPKKYPFGEIKNNALIFLGKASFYHK